MISNSFTGNAGPIFSTFRTVAELGGGHARKTSAFNGDVSREAYTTLGSTNDFIKKIILS